MKSLAPSRLAYWRGALQFAGDGFDLITQRVHGIHRAIADKPFQTLAPLPAIGDSTAPVRQLHDSITDGVYGVVRLSGNALIGAAAEVLKQADRVMPPTPVTPDFHRDSAIAALGGLFGDHAARKRNPLMPQLGFYKDGSRHALTPAALAEAYPQATRKLVVFVHGLSCTEHGWKFYVDPAQPDTADYGTRLAVEFGYTPLYLRYNTGLHISKNGRRLSRQLAQLLVGWPTEVDEIVLIGHSMGGLVLRAAAAHAMTLNEGWASKVSRLICLGSPHRGAPLEQAVDGLTRVLGRFDLTRPWGELLEARSVGVRDLKHGATSDADWRSGVTREWRPPQAIARLPHAQYHFIGCSLGASERDPLGQFLGDGLVRLPSSLAADLADAHTVTLFKVNHMRLLNHPLVYRHLREAIAR
ncbi:MAG: GPI inositol-deacylase [Pseudomonadota bacterium]|nr:GPI inositol-deacylase [Pseudomonadota bacterium]